MPGHRILLVEDDPDLARWLKKSLEQLGFFVEWEEDGHMAKRRLGIDTFDAVVLDLGLPSLGGEAVLRARRSADDPTPVIVVTARDGLADRVSLLRDGADDFLGKPFAIEELEARLVALVRRSRGRANGLFTCGPLTFDERAQRFTVGDHPLALTPREHAVLRVLVRRLGEPVAKQDLLDHLVASDADLSLEAIEVIVHRLRRKLAETGVHIVTLRGLGYLLEAQDAGR
ncbi:response regulator [Aureimonas frigidaquae]|uniref:Transcriptional regulator TctD 4 n=1 Tax=Aureimonas frigidaquae TaxID=424757 RepID=A0A0P0Z1G2_9HYPH|nr:response regulator [Aureimonas frigidaquae]BAT27827.1 transcriptional regulator TctD 4 [Aureimonas frigidaquae]